jgi:sulfur carrier protein
MRLSCLFIAAPRPIFMALAPEGCQRGSRVGAVRLELSGRILLNWRSGSICRFWNLRELPLATHLKDGREIIVNGDRLATRAGTLAELLAELGFAGKRIATARNGDFVSERARVSTTIEGGDRIEIVSPRHGG